jgi:hypothetical protein
VRYLKRLFWTQYGFNIQKDTKEPDWNALFNFGLPLNIANNKIKKYKYDTIIKNIVLASHFLNVNKNNTKYLRHYDSFKALLLALKTHYPSRYKEIEKNNNINFLRYFNLDIIQGKHIKLRNICLSNLSDFFRNK